MSSDAKDTPIKALSANIVDTRFENFDRKTFENARDRIIDVLGCCLCGARRRLQLSPMEARFRLLTLQW